MSILRNLLQSVLFVRSRANLPPLIPLKLADSVRGLPGLPESAHAAIQLYNEGDFRGAARKFKQIVLKSHRTPTLLAFLGLCQMASGDKGAAEGTFREVRKTAPELPTTLVTIAESLKRGGFGQSAVTAYLLASELEPSDASIPLAAAMQLYDIGLGDVGAEWLRQRNVINDAIRVFGVISMLPGIYRSKDELQDLLAIFEQRLSQLESMSLSIQNPLYEVGITSFYLAYAGIDERPLQERLAKVFMRATPSLMYKAPHCASSNPRKPGPKRIGFLSQFFKNHSVGFYYMDLIRGLADKRGLAIYVISVNGSIDQTFRQEAKSQGLYLDLPLDLDRSRTAVAELELDVLVFADVGLHPFSFFLAFSRLALMQCVLPGHPATSGIPTIDWFISSSQLEGKNADSFYTEKLVRLKNPPLVFPPPPRIDSLPTRDDLKLRSDAHLYVCPTRLQKLHPDFDLALAGILATDPQAEILLFEDAVAPEWGQRLRLRFQHSLGKAAARVLFLPWANLSDLRKIVNVSDVSLDTFYFGGGVTSHFVLDTGCPVVTWPSPFLRGRSTLACYEQMGISDCVAKDPQEYIRLAVRIGCDAEYRRDIRSRILARKGVLYSNTNAVEELGDIFLSDASRPQ